MAISTVVLPDVDRSLTDHFERQVARVSDRVAAADATHTWTYAELDRTANHIARALLAHSATTEQTVALVLGHEVRMIAAILGVLKAAKIYVPLDPALPTDRLAYVLDDAQVGVVITDTRHAPALGALPGALPAILNLDELDSSAPASAPKIRGYRVEIAEVEMALLAIAEVKDAFVAAHRNDHGEGSLVAYVVATAGCAPTVSALRAALAQTLPPYMLPRAFVPLDALPRLLNGKVDRLALPAPPRARPALGNPLVAPRNAIEAQIARVWEEALEVDGIGVTDDFLELGGDSLRVTQVLSGIRERYCVEPTLARLLEVRTVADLAIEVLLARAADLGGADLEHVLARIEPTPDSDHAGRGRVP